MFLLFVGQMSSAQRSEAPLFSGKPARTSAKPRIFRRALLARPDEDAWAYLA